MEMSQREPFSKYSTQDLQAGDARNLEAAQYCHENKDLYLLIKHLGRAGAEVSFVTTALVLGIFGSSMSGRALGLCWAMLLVKLLMDFSIRRSWKWMMSYMSSRFTTTAAEKLQEPAACRQCSRSGQLVLTPADRVRGEASATCIKLILAILLLVNLDHDVEVSAAPCSEPCKIERSRQYVRGLAILVTVVEGIPLLLLRSFSRPTSVAAGDLQGSTSGGRGNFEFNRLKRSHHLLWHALQLLHNADRPTWLQVSLILQSFLASGFSAVLVSTACLLLGGNFGIFMTSHAFWLCWFVVVVELLAEGACPTATALYRHWKPHIAASAAAASDAILQPDTYDHNRKMKEENRKLQEEAIAKLLLRFPVEAILCGALFQTLRKQVNYYAPDVDEQSCDAICKANSKALLQVMCFFTGGQAVASILFPICAPLQFLAALLPAYLTFCLMFILLATGPLLIVVSFVYVTVGGRLVSSPTKLTLVILWIMGYSIAEYTTRSWSGAIVWRNSRLLHLVSGLTLLIITFSLTLSFLLDSKIPNFITMGIIILIVFLVCAMSLGNRETHARAANG